MDIIVKVNDKGLAVYAAKHFGVGDVVVRGKPIEELPGRTRYSLQVDVDIHVRMDEPFELVNHSCDPNTGVKLNNLGGYDLVAMRHIKNGEEITFDYAMTEWISIAVPDCKCNSNICRKKIEGGKYLSKDLLNKYDGFLAPFYDLLRHK